MRARSLTLFLVLIAWVCITSGCESDDDTGDTLVADLSADTNMPGMGCPEQATGNAPAEALDCSVLSSDVTLVNSPDRTVDYIVDCSAQVTASLTIEAGTVIQFAEGAGILVRDTGTINSQGEMCKPVVFEGASATAGSWYGIRIASAGDNQLTYTDVRHAGASAGAFAPERAGLVLLSGAQATLSNVQLSQNQMYGLHAAHNNITLSLDTVTLSGNEGPAAFISGGIATALGDDNSTFANNTDDVVELGSTVITADTTIPNIDVPWRVIAVTEATPQLAVNGAVLTVEAGAEIRFTETSGIAVQETMGSRLVAQGSSDTPIVLRGSEERPGAWIGVTLSSAEENVLEHVNIRHGGADPGAFVNNYANVVLNNGAQVSLSNVTLTQSQAYGLHAAHDDITLSLDTVTLSDNEGPAAFISGGVAAALGDDNSTFANNTDDVVELGSTVITADTTIPNIDVPWRVIAVTEATPNVQVRDAVLTIEAGAILRFTSAAGLSAIGGGINAQGSETAPILLTGDVESAASWQGVYLESDTMDMGDYRFDHVELAFAGARSASGGMQGALITWGADVVFTNGVIRDAGAGCGILGPLSGDEIDVTGTVFMNNGTDVCDPD